MGDRTYTTIRFSGGIAREKVDALIEAIDADGLYPDDTGNDPPNEHNLDGWFYGLEVNYADLENCQAAAQELTLSYIKQWAAGDDYDPGIEIYNALVDQTFTINTIDGEPAVTLSELEKKSDTEIIAYLRMFMDSDKHYPPLEIVDA